MITNTKVLSSKDSKRLLNIIATDPQFQNDEDTTVPVEEAFPRLHHVSICTKLNNTSMQAAQQLLQWRESKPGQLDQKEIKDLKAAQTALRKTCSFTANLVTKWDPITYRYWADLAVYMYSY